MVMTRASKMMPLSISLMDFLGANAFFLVAHLFFCLASYSQDLQEQSEPDLAGSGAQGKIRALKAKLKEMQTKKDSFCSEGQGHQAFCLAEPRCVLLTKIVFTFPIPLIA